MQTDSAFSQEVLTGLSVKPKKLSSKYFYNAEGDQLFQQIMHLDEYYLTHAELDIFTTNKSGLLKLLASEVPFRILELGPGDGLKTKILLKYFTEQHADFTYCPVEISNDALQALVNNLSREIPDLKINPLAGDYFKVLGDLKLRAEKKNVVFFLGSNIGNFIGDTVRGFLKSIHGNLNPGDLMLIGFDLKKDPKRILNAYNDAAGITRRFNLNLLKRINDELGGDFDPETFIHYPVYDPMTGECRSYLVSKKQQSVAIRKLDRTFLFEAWEPVLMEVSKKYTIGEIDQLARETGFGVVENYFDNQQLFTDSVWRVI